MMRKLRDWATTAGVLACLAPILWIWGVHVFGEWLANRAYGWREWRWVQRLVATSDKVAAWGDRYEPN